ncbi:MAG: M56 family metallopeptidase [Pirellulales bacterium]
MTASQWLEVLISFSVQVAVLITACTTLERAVVRAADRCAVWNTFFLSVLLLGVGAVLLPRLHLLHPWSGLDSQTVLAVNAAQSAIGTVVLSIWCVGAALSLVRWIARGYLLRRDLQRCERLSDERAVALLNLANLEFPGPAPPVVLISDDADGPFCWQLHSPTLVLPRFLLDGDADDLRHVLLHELEHLKTNHPVQLFLQHLAQVVFWFHPSVWRAGSIASLVRELTCDEVAARVGAGSAAYLRTLLHIAERCEQRRNASAIGFSRTPSEIVLRARRLVELAKNPQGTASRWGLGRWTACAAVLAAMALSSLVWIPSDPLASPRSLWSPWPKWTAQALHCFGYNLRDYEEFDRRTQVYELSLDCGDPSVPAAAPSADGLSPNS